MRHNRHHASCTTCTFDRARAIGFRLLFARASLLPGAAHAEWITRNEAIMGTRCAVELWSEDQGEGRGRHLVGV